MFKRVLVLITIAGLGIGAFAGYAYSSKKDGVSPQSHDFAVRSGPVKRIMYMVQNDASTVTNPALSSFTADTITVPATGNYRIAVRFSAESACSAASWCSAVIFVDGVETNPKSSTDFAFDSPGGETWQGLTMERISDNIAGTGAARNVIVDVQLAVVGGGSWRLDDWTVASELYKG